MVGGISDTHCEKDIIDAVALGADAFALNLGTFDIHIIYAPHIHIS